MRKTKGVALHPLPMNVSLFIIRFTVSRSARLGSTRGREGDDAASNGTCGSELPWERLLGGAEEDYM